MTNQPNSGRQASQANDLGNFPNEMQLKARLIRDRNQLINQGKYPAVATKILIRKTKLGKYPHRALYLMTGYPNMFSETQKEKEARKIAAFDAGRKDIPT